jgi:hypothetical protein
VKPARTLVKIRHGSHLYGTSTPASDTDYKGVHLPSGPAIMLQRAENVIDRKVKASDTIKNQVGDVDDQSYSLQKFLEMLAKGDTVATEILFAPEEMIVEAAPEWKQVQVLRSSFLNRQCKGFVGYCQRQAAKYGIKGSRMAACRDIRALLAEGVSALGTTAKLAELDPALREFVAEHEFSSIVDIPSQAGTPVLHLDVVDRKVPFSASIKSAYDIFDRVWINYGERSRAAMLNEGIDWKAVSHAVRVARQAIELLETGSITFPRPDAAELLEIKKGLRPYSEVSELLERLVEQVNETAASSPLPEKSDTARIDATVLAFYREQVAA